MIVTPSASSGFMSGAGFWALLWSFIFKIDTVLKFCRLKIQLRDRILEWVRHNKILALLCTEVINIGAHGGAANANVASFILGGTLMNVFMIFSFVPGFHLLFGRRKLA